MPSPLRSEGWQIIDELNRSFAGEVQQIRLNPTVQQNVVTYNVRVSLQNPEQILLPGMTAYVNIAVARRDDALLVTVNSHVTEHFFLLPGGGQDHGESMADTVRRECREELSADVNVGDIAFVRDYLAEQSGWNKNSDVPPPALPASVVAATRDRYLEAYTRLTGRPFTA